MVDSRATVLAHHFSNVSFVHHSAAITIGFDPTEYRVNEDEGPVRLRLVADRASETPYSVNITLTDDDAICK